MDKLKTKYGAGRIACHVWHWEQYPTTTQEDRWVPFYVLKNLGKIRTIQELWDEYTTGCDGQLSIMDLENGWDTDWRKGNASARANVSRRKKVVELINKLAKKPNWNIGLALRFLKDKYLIESKSPTPHLRTVRQFIDKLQSRTEGSGFEIEIIEASNLYTH